MFRSQKLVQCMSIHAKVRGMNVREGGRGGGVVVKVVYDKYSFFDPQFRNCGGETQGTRRKGKYLLPL